jgi:ATP:ADP antiporter, AAA family
MRKLEYTKTKSLGSCSRLEFQPIWFFFKPSDGTQLAPANPEGASVYSQNSRTHRAFERVLSIFAPVRKGEGLTSVLLMMNVFLLLTAYYIIKPVREALILGELGPEIKAYAGAAQALLFLFIVPVYSYIASRVNRIRLINGVTAFFISNLLVFYFMGQAQVRLGMIFFLWVGLFNLMLIAQFWAFANDVYTHEQGKRLFAIIGIGSSLGGIFGARTAGGLFKPLGPYTMMLVTAGLLTICMGLTTWVNHRERRAIARNGRKEAEDTRLAPASGFALVLKSRYLLLIAMLILLANMVNTTGEFILGKAVAQHAKALAGAPGSAAAEAYIGGFYANFYFWVNLMGAALQMFAVSRIIKRFDIRPALFFLPIIALGSYALLAFVPILSFIRIAKIAENSTDYSIQNTARHALFLNTNRESKYKAKTAIDSFFWRAGDALSGLLVFVGTQLAFDIRNFALVNIVLVGVWLYVAYGIVRIDRRRTDAQPSSSSEAQPEAA